MIRQEEGKGQASQTLMLKMLRPDRFMALAELTLMLRTV